LIGDLGAAINAFRVDPEQHVYPISGAFGDLGSENAGIEPERDGSMPQVVWPGR
jgi:hypothetical protein